MVWIENISATIYATPFLFNPVFGSKRDNVFGFCDIGVNMRPRDSMYRDAVLLQGMMGEFMFYIPAGKRSRYRSMDFPFANSPCGGGVAESDFEHVEIPVTIHTFSI